MSFTLQQDQVKLFVLVYGFLWAFTLVVVYCASSGLTLHKIPLNNGKRNSEFKKFPRLTFFFLESIYIDESLQKIYISLAPNCMSLWRVTRKIVATIGTLKKIILTRCRLGKMVALCVGQRKVNFGLI